MKSEPSCQRDNTYSRVQAIVSGDKGSKNCDISHKQKTDCVIESVFWCVHNIRLNPPKISFLYKKDSLYHSVYQGPGRTTAVQFSSRQLNILHYSLRTGSEAYSVFPLTSIEGTSLWVRRPDLEAGLSGLLQRLRTLGTSFHVSYRLCLCRYSA